MFKNKQLLGIAEKYHKSVAQIVLRYLIQNKIMVIPSSTNPVHMQENFDVFDFSLTNSELEQVRQLDRKESVVGWPSDMLMEQDY